MNINMGITEMREFLESMPVERAINFCMAFNLVTETTGATDFKIHFKEQYVEFFDEHMNKLCEMVY